jgi:hypothetical protein
MSCETSLPNGTCYQMISWVPHSYNVHFSAGGSVPRGIVLNKPKHIGIDCCHNCFKSCYTIFDSPGRGFINVLLQVSSQGKSPLELHLVTEEALQLALIVQSRSTSASKLEAHLQVTSRTVSRKSWYCRAVSRSGTDMRPKTVSLMIPAQTLMLKWAWYPSSGFFFFFWKGGGESQLGTSATICPIVPPRMMNDEYGTVCGMRIGSGNWSTQRKPAPVPLYPPQMPHDLTRDRTQAATVGSWLLNRLSCGMAYVRG